MLLPMTLATMNEREDQAGPCSELDGDRLAPASMPLNLGARKVPLAARRSASVRTGGACQTSPSGRVHE